MMDQDSTLLVVAHPGHELRLHGWIERARPMVAVITDGSGGAGVPRLEATRGLLAKLGARPAPLFGPCTDRELYAAAMEGDLVFFQRLLDGIRASAVACGATRLVSDAAEGFNPAHDLCHHLAAMVAEEEGLEHFDFPLEARPDACPQELAHQSHVLRLDEAALARKRAAVESYTELQEELARADSEIGFAAFGLERLRPAAASRLEAGRRTGPPYFEIHGERMVAEGRYREVLKESAHLEPLLARLRMVPVRA